jgi:tetratricopeptide (TPR) repeat protein
VLDFLTREDVDDYLSLEFPHNRFPPELASMIHLKTEGNALFMADVVRYLSTRGVIADDRGSWTLVGSLPDIQSDLPQSVRSMVQRKIDSLSDADRRLLMAASVQGYEFDSVVVAKVVDLDGAEVEERLDILDRVHAFVRRVGERDLPDSTLTLRYAFVHSLYQNALYSALAPTRRTSWSATVAEALLNHYGDQSTGIAAELALLFEVARDFNRSAEYFIAAGRNAASVCANGEAIGLFERALANAGKLREIPRHRNIFNAATQLGRVYDTLTRPNECAEAFRLATKAAAEMNDPEAQVESMCGAANALFYAHRSGECREECERAYEVTRRHNLGDAIASIDSVHSLQRLSAGDFDAATESFKRAMGVLRNKGLSAVSLPGMTFRGGLHVWRLEHSEADEVLGWTMQKARELGMRGRILSNFYFQTISLGHQGRLGEALQTMSEARRIAELNGERFVLARIPNTFGWLHRELFDLEQALKFDMEGIRLSQQVVDDEAEINSRINAGQIHLLLGEYEHAFEHLQGAESLLEHHTWFNWVFRIRLEAELASYWIAKGDLPKAGSHISNSLAVATRALSRKHMAWGFKLKADVAALEDRVDDARSAYEAALSILARHPCPPIEWQIRKAYAELFRRAGQPGAGDDQIRHARALVNNLADSVAEESLRRALLTSKPVCDLV